MSQKQRPAPNPIITMLIWGAMIFLGYTLFFADKTGGDSRASAEVYTQIVKLNEQGKDITLQREVNIYKAALEAEAEKEIDLLKKAVDVDELTDDELETQSQQINDLVKEKNFEAAILLADTQFASGLHYNNQGKLEAAYNSLNALYNKHGRDELWLEKTWDVQPYGEVLTESNLTASELYSKLTTNLSEMNKEAKILDIFPGYQVIDWLVNLTGANPQFSYWFAALMLAVLVRLAIFPLAQKQFIWGRKMSQLSPYIKEIKEKFTDKKTKQVTDQQAMSVETMALYKRYGMNPFSGCLPLLIQMPLFLLIYQFMLLYKFEFTKGHFLWVQEGAGTFLGLPLAQNLGEKDYILVVVYGISMIVTTLMTPVSDPSNVKQQRMIGIGMALVFSVMMFFWSLPSAFITYWIFTNILATVQSLLVFRMHLDPLVPVQTEAGGVIPATGRDVNGSSNKVSPGFFDKAGTGQSKKKKKKKR